MTKEEVVKYFGSQKAACEALNITKGAFSQWKEVPKLRQFEFQLATNGVLRVSSKFKVN